MTDIQAAVGREQLKRLDGIVRQRRALADRYRSLLAPIAGLRLPDEPGVARSNWQSYAVRLADDLDQRAVMQAMLETGVSTRRGIMCSHREEAYRDAALPHALPHSERAQDHSILLPLYAQMTTAEQDQVVAALAAACASHGTVAATAQASGMDHAATQSA